MPITDTPLRYPGGKSQLAPFVGTVLTLNDLQGGHYAEPFAGGAGIAWRLLFTGQASEIWLNDIDPAVYAFWKAAVHDTDALCERIHNATVTMEEWHQQRSVFKDAGAKPLDRAFATLFLNRTNRSGILDGGVIGGLQQTGNYKIDCRFNKADLARKVQRIGRYREVIHLSNEDARLCLARWDKALPARALINIDPPYYGKGSELYINHFKPGDHASLSMQVRRLKHRWMMTYDDTPEIEGLYRTCPMFRTSLLYSAQTKRKGAELLITDSALLVPQETTQNKLLAA
ncbi:MULTISPECIES: DNA adenine methylase [unclassified Acidovorax]|uniref:DNA adenine methylase n=1 Tax=unclassified Acidovorax TaxID=2684926 RepID=UPI001C44C7D0|nr:MULTISPECIES: DNA adenine methylase [unclassified Acidovorax]